MIIILNIINQGKVLDPAGKRDEATHHAVEELGDKYRPNPYSSYINVIYI